MPRRMNRTGKTGFTLIEMLVVMSIMVIVMGIMLPALMPLLGSKGVEGSAQKLMAVLMNARALAAKENVVVAVTFHMSGNASSEVDEGVAPIVDKHTYTGYGMSRDWSNCWYAIVKNVDPSTKAPFNRNNNASDDFNYQQVGPRYALEEGCGFLAITYADKEGDRFDSFDGNNLKWDSHTIYTSRNTNTVDADGKPVWASVDGTNTFVSNGGKVELLADGYLGNFRIEFSPDGTAAFVMPPGFDAYGNFQYIVISKEGTISNKSYYDTRLAVRINKVTGMADIVNAHLDP